ncbi:MAG: signal transduction histidine kinase/ligand-binding sensor domain-containing protein, partial [Phenylobacterium sp.]
MNSRISTSPVHWPFLLLLLFCYPQATQAAEPVTRFNRISLEQGLSQASIRSIFIDSKGFLWFGTQDGLNRYDGYGFTIFRHDPKVKNSISNNWIRVITEDASGALWVGTDDGLNRYDHQSQGFVRFQHQPPNPHSLNHNTIRSIFQDSGGTLWIGTDGGLNRLNPALANPDNQHFSHFKHDSEDSRSLSHNTVKTIFEDSHGTLWFGTEAGGLNRFDRPLNSKNSPQQGFIHYQHDPLNPHSISHNNVKTMVEDAQGTLWIGTYVGGINKFDKETGRFSHYQHNPEDPHSLSDNNVLSSYLDSQGTLWFGTDGGGLNKYDQQHNRFVHFRHQPSDAHSLSADIIWSLGEDNNGALWVGTQTGGLNKLDLNNNRLNHFKHQPSDPYSLSSNTIKAIYKTQQDELWIGTNTNGLNRYDQQSSQFVHFKHQRSNPHSLSDDRVRAILQDSKGRLWIGTAGGGLNLFDHTNQRFKHWLNDKNDPDSLSNNRVIALLEDADGVLWVGTWGGGLNRFDPDSGKFSHYRHDEANPSSLSHNKISTVFEDSKGTLWVGTAGGGLNRFNRQSQQFDHYTHQASANHSISHNNITTIHEDRNGALWVSTFGGGLNKYETKKGRFVHYRQRHGIANDSIYGMLEDDSGNLWLSTNQGLTRFNPATRAYRNFDVFDGLQSNEFNFGAYFKGSDGELFFGGINGFNRFFPDQINDDRQIPPIVLTDFRLFNQSIDIAVPANPADSSANSANLSLTATTNDQQAPPFTLTKAIDELDLLTLNYQQNLMSFEFAALHFANPMQNQYAYFLEGWDKDWITTDASNRRATYTNIPQGKYTLRVKASNSQGYWDEQGKALTIIITPPPWKTSGAYVFYALLVSGLGWIFITVRAERSRRKNQQALNHHLKQVDKLKDQFLANTSHELRTPLNGIIGLTEALLDGVAGPLPHKANHNLALVVSSSKRLSNLVNDILDFAKLENHSVELHPIALDLHQIAENMLTLSRPLIGDKNLALINDVAVGLPAVLADEDRLAQIFHNLLGNAIKFTDKGYIIVSAIELDGWLNISIKDTGIGIAEDKFSAIFQSFEQIKGNTTRLHSGTGLGLAVSKQLVALHGGQIEVSSTIDEGSTFSFTLPTSDENPANNTGHQKVSHVHSFEHVDSTPAVEHAATEETHHPLNELADYDGSRFRLLLVDDEPVNLQVLHDHLSSQGYQLVEVSSGQQALQAIAQDGPFDLVLLDIMMPHMSGYQVCKTLRESHTINDLPIIFLTAKNQVTDLVQSFASGGNDYLSKPVSKHELLTRVATHLKLLDSMRHNAQSKDIRIDERTLALEQANRRMSTIIEISTQISGALDINKLLETAYKNIK